MSPHVCMSVYARKMSFCFEDVRNLHCMYMLGCTLLSGCNLHTCVLLYIVCTLTPPHSNTQCCLVLLLHLQDLGSMEACLLVGEVHSSQAPPHCPRPPSTPSLASIHTRTSGPSESVWHRSHPSESGATHVDRARSSTWTWWMRV